MNEDDSYFRGRVALVTGGARGIGRAYCEGFARLGCHVVVADIDGSRAQTAAEEISSLHHVLTIGVAVDVAIEDSVSNLFRHLQDAFDGLDFLVNNAAVMLDVPVVFKPFWDTSYAEWNRIMAVNVGGVFLCCRYAVPLLRRRSGARIVNISSDAIYKGYDGQLAYFASKGAVAVMTRNLAREVGPLEICVNAVAPGYTKSEAVASSVDMQQVEPLVLASQCLPRVQMPADVVGTVLFLCGPGSKCITGQSIVVNCGAIMP